MDLWPASSLRERLGIQHALIQAPMTMISTARLVAAVSHAGALGSLGSATMSAAQIEAQVAAIRALTGGAFALNFFLHTAPVLDAARAKALSQRLEPYRRELGVSDAPLLDVPPPFDDVMLAAVSKWKPAAVSFHFGVPAAHVLQALKRAEIYVMGCATTVAEALALEQAGCDAVIAQGVEAGGHRGTFAEPYALGEIGSISLVPQIVDAVKVPVIAAGGIADGRGIAAALLLGASAVQLGTAFLTSDEAEIDPTYRQVLLTERARATRITRVFTGRPARAIVNRLTEELADLEQSSLAYPLQRAYTGPLGKAGLHRQDPELHSLFAGQSAALARPLPAAALIARLVAETEQAFARAPHR